MKKVHLVINAEVELQGKHQFLNKEIRTNKTHFLLYSKDYDKAQVNYCKLVPNEDGEYYNILELDLEQGRRFCIGIIIEAEVVVENDNVIEKELMFHICSMTGTFKPVQAKITNIDVSDV